METKPFHESIVRALRSAKTKEELAVLEKLILSTKIPKDTDLVLRAFRSKAKKLEVSDAKVLKKLEQEGE